MPTASRTHSPCRRAACRIGLASIDGHERHVRRRSVPELRTTLGTKVGKTTESQTRAAQEDKDSGQTRFQEAINTEVMLNFWNGLNGSNLDRHDTIWPH